MRDALAVAVALATAKVVHHCSMDFPNKKALKGWNVAVAKRSAATVFKLCFAVAGKTSPQPRTFKSLFERVTSNRIKPLTNSNSYVVPPTTISETSLGSLAPLSLIAKMRMRSVLPNGRSEICAFKSVPLDNSTNSGSTPTTCFSTR